MADLIRFRLDDGGAVLVEAEREPGVERTSRTGQVLEDARSSFEEALASVRDVAAVAIGQFRSMAPRPDEVEIKFSVRLDARAGAVIAQAGVQGQLEVRVRCTFSDHPGGRREEEPERDEPTE